MALAQILGAMYHWGVESQELMRCVNPVGPYGVASATTPTWPHVANALARAIGHCATAAQNLQ
eukprot:7348039-Pyramimonas_sp.AAC.2